MCLFLDISISGKIKIIIMKYAIMNPIKNIANKEDLFKFLFLKIIDVIIIENQNEKSAPRDPIEINKMVIAIIIAIISENKNFLSLLKYAIIGIEEITYIENQDLFQNTDLVDVVNPI
jgi:hypothetical protein